MKSRDRTIVTYLRWIRRYVMRRNAEEWDAVEKHESIFAPYVSNVFEWVRASTAKCTIVPSREYEWEADHYSDMYVVNLKDNICTCFHWELTSIPFSHACVCFIDKRQRKEDFVDAWYNKNKYIETNTPHIKHMHGMKQWTGLTKFKCSSMRFQRCMENHM